MRFILAIVLFFSLKVSGQVINASQPYRPFTAASSCSYLLDTYSGAAAAYSLRKLDCDYAGYAIKVRRSSDNTEQDIGFTGNGDLDTASLKSFVGSNSGYVVTWYDQSGNSSNVTQSTAGNQPRIVNAGVVERQGSNPAVTFVAANSNYLSGGDILDLSELYLNFYAAVKWGSAANQTLLGKSRAAGLNGRWSLLKDANTLYWFAENTSNSQSTVSYNNTDYSLFEGYINKSSDTVQLKKNNSQIALSLIPVSDNATNTTDNFYVGVYQNSTGDAPLSGYYLDGKIGEIIIYRKLWNTTERTGINNNINTYYSIY